MVNLRRKNLEPRMSQTGHGQKNSPRAFLVGSISADSPAGGLTVF
jgi:hypothetical protein